MHVRSGGIKAHPRPGRRRWRVLVVSCAFFAGSALAIAIVLPSPIDPAPIAPEPLAPLAGALAPNERLATVERLPLGQARGAEDIAVDPEGRLYAGVEDGRILRLTVLADGAVRPETFARTTGRPLGLRFAPDGTLLVAVAGRGLLAIDPDGEARELATSAGGAPIRVANHLDVARDGTVYFTDSSARHDLEDHRLDLMEARPSGRLLAFDPGTGEARVLDSGLFFPNGVTLTAGEDALLVAETGRSRILRYPLENGRLSPPEPLLVGLPGYPDNLARDERGVFWLALFTTRNRLLDAIHPHAWLKGRIAALPRFLQPEPARYGCVLSFDESGRVIESLQDPGGRWTPNLTAARPSSGVLYLGNLDASWIGRLVLGETRGQ